MSSGWTDTLHNAIVTNVWHCLRMRVNIWSVVVFVHQTIHSWSNSHLTHSVWFGCWALCACGVIQGSCAVVQVGMHLFEKMTLLVGRSGGGGSSTGARLQRTGRLQTPVCMPPTPSLFPRPSFTAVKPLCASWKVVSSKCIIHLCSSFFFSTLFINIWNTFKRYWFLSRVAGGNMCSRWRVLLQELQERLPWVLSQMFPCPSAARFHTHANMCGLRFEQKFQDSYIFFLIWSIK